MYGVFPVSIVFRLIGILNKAIACFDGFYLWDVFSFRCYWRTEWFCCICHRVLSLQMDLTSRNFQIYI